MAFDVEAIEKRIDRSITGSIEVGGDGEGIAIKHLVDAMEVAKVISTSKQAIPPFMRGEPGLCYAAVVRAVRWRMDPYFVCENMYLVNNKGEEKVAFMAQLIVAVINAHAPIQGRIRVRYEGKGDERYAVCYAIPRGEKDAVEYETPTLGELKAVRGTNERGQLKGSPLYISDPDQQLWYYGARGLCRRYFPEVLGGVYDRDEFEDVKDVTPKPSTGLVARLEAANEKASKRKRRGFDPDHVEREAGNVIDATREPNADFDTRGTPQAGGEQLDIETEAKRKAAFEAGKAAPIDHPIPDELKAPGREIELEAWIEGHASVIQQDG